MEDKMSWLDPWSQGISNLVVDLTLLAYFGLGFRRGVTHKTITGTLCVHPANERWRYIVTSSLIGWAHTQNDFCIMKFSAVIIYWSFQRNIARSVLKMTRPTILMKRRRTPVRSWSLRCLSCRWWCWRWLGKWSPWCRWRRKRLGRR